MSEEQRGDLPAIHVEVRIGHVKPRIEPRCLGTPRAPTHAVHACLNVKLRLSAGGFALNHSFTFRQVSTSCVRAYSLRNYVPMYKLGNTNSVTFG